MNSSFNALKFPHVPSPARVSTPTRPSRLSRFGAAVWRALEGVGQSRARRDILALADRWDADQPELAAQLRASCRAPGSPNRA